MVVAGVQLRLFGIADLLKTTRNGDYVLIEHEPEVPALDEPAVLVKAG